MFYVRTWRPGVQAAENDDLLTRPTPARRDALFLKRRSQSPVSLQRTARVRFSRRVPCGLAGMSF